MPNPTTLWPGSPIVAVVDDDESVREALCDLLAVIDIRCREFDRAEGLLMEYRAGTFDCVITDVRMPGMSGLELQQRLRVADPQLPVIFVSADASPVTRARAFAGGAAAYLAKPVGDDILFTHLRAVLARGRAADVGGDADE